MIEKIYIISKLKKKIQFLKINKNYIISRLKKKIQFLKKNKNYSFCQCGKLDPSLRMGILPLPKNASR